MREFNQSAARAVSDSRAIPQRRSSHPGLYAVPEKLIGPPQAMRLLTTAEETQVKRATVRESFSHRYWPPDVLAALLETDVIKNN